MTKLTRRHFLRATAGLSAGALLVACTPATAPQGQPAADDAAPATEKATVLVWDAFGEQAASMDQLIATFQENNPDIEVTREEQSTEAMRDIIRTSLDADAGPDVLYYDTGPGFAGVLARAGLLLELDDAYAQYGWDERLLPIAKARTTFDGKTYGIGNAIECVGMFYNRRIFEENGLSEPATHDDLLAICETLKGVELYPIAFGNQGKWPAGHTFSVFSGNIAGTEKLAGAISGEVPWNDPDFVRAIQISMVELNEAGYYNPDVNAISYDDANLLFYSGQAAMHLTGTWMIAGYTDPNNMPDPVGFFFYPPTDNKPIAPPAGLGSGYFVSQKAKNPEAALQFLDFLFSEEAAGVWLEQMAIIPPLQIDATQYNISELLAFAVQQLQENAETMGFNIDVLTPDNFNTMMFDGFQEVLNGTKSAEQQADDLEAAMQQAKDEGKVMDITE
jgi:raffinose/stachyose/melibiose transport system substrate-binding protein